MDNDKQTWRSETKKIMAVSSLGLMLPSAIAVGLLFGYILDRIFGTRPWMLITFLLLGTASGIINLLQGLNRMQNGNKKAGTKNNHG